MSARFLFPVWLLLSGRADVPPPVQSEPAHIVVYRQREFEGGAYDVKINGQKLGALPSNRYLQGDVPAGRVKVESVGYFSDNQIVQFDAQPGRTYYVKAVEEIDFLSSALLLAPVSEALGQREVQGIKPAAKPRTKAR